MQTQVYQIFYHKDQTPHLDSAFTSYDNSGKTYPYNFEYAVFFELSSQINWAQIDLVGTVSWKFTQKTALQAKDFLNQINQNPGQDVYFINPFPELVTYQSVWQQGEDSHPEFLKKVQNLLRSAGYDESIVNTMTPPYLTAYCNYWVANEKFWKDYIQFLTPLWTYILTNKNSLTNELLMKADSKINAPYLPFIFERMFSTFLALNSYRTHQISMYYDLSRSPFYLRPYHRTLAKIIQLKSIDDISFVDKIILIAFRLLKLLKHQLEGNKTP